MATRNFVPRANGEGSIGTPGKNWGAVYAEILKAQNLEIAGMDDVATVFDSFLLGRNKTYAVGDVAYSPNLPSYLRLECVVGGTTGATEPDFSTPTGGAQ
jgi:hypothetical protein